MLELGNLNTTLVILAMSLNLLPLSENHNSLNNSQEACFAASMIGYDYVINSRAGLPIERALNTVTVDVDSSDIYDTYKYSLKTIVTNAYQWKNTPHMYAIKVMHSCAFNQGLDSKSL